MREVAVKKEEPEAEAEQDEEQIEKEEEAEVEQAEAAPADKKKKQPVQRESKVLQEMRNNEDRNLKEWLEEIAPGGALRVKVTRTSPKMWKGLNVGGSLATYDQQIDEDWIREHHGGGDFYLIVQKPKVNGAGWQYAGGRVIRIAGDPRTDDVFRDKTGSEQQTGGRADAPATAIVDRVVGSLERQLEREQQRQSTAQHGPDTETMRMLMSPMQRQIDQMSAMLREKDTQLADARQPRPVERDEFRDRMLATMMEGDSARITTLREQHASELRQIKEGAMQNEARLRDSFERDKQSLGMAHDRELNALRSAYDMKVSAQESAQNTARALMDGEIRRLQADLTEAKSELAALRLKKDKTILEQASEFAAIKEAIGEITGGEEKEKSGWEKALEVAGNLPIVQQQLARLGSEPPAAAPQPAPQIVRPPMLLRGPDGHLYRQSPDGQMQLVKRRSAPPRPEGEEAALPEIPATTVKVAVDFLETAFRGGQEPEQVATSVRSMIPAEVMAVIRSRGVDGFLTDVAKLDGSSPLSSQSGRNWVRKVGKSLLGG
jgi:hypothetical protein